MSDASTASLHAVNAGIHDVLDGFETLKDRAETEIVGIAQDLDAMHRRHAGEIAARLSALGEATDDGTIRGTVNKIATTLRDWTGSLDADALSFVREGEELCLANYDEALENMDAAADSEDREMIARQAAEIRAKIAALPSN